MISIHASREGSDLALSLNVSPRVISIHASREGSDVESCHFRIELSISIHASREGSDFGLCSLLRLRLLISIHASREGSDLRQWLKWWQVQFQSTLPAREATGRIIKTGEGDVNFNPRFPRGKRLHLMLTFSFFWISIHASREGSDQATKS